MDEAGMKNMSQTTSKTLPQCGSFPWMKVREHAAKSWKARKITVTYGSRGHKLKHSVSAVIPSDLSPSEEAVVNYIVDSMAEKMSKLIPFSLENRSVFEMAKFLLRYRSGSKGTLWRYVHALHQFCEWCGKNPDEMILACIDQDGCVNVRMLQQYAVILDEWVGLLQAKGKAPMTINGSITALRAFYKHNGLDVPYNFTLPKRIANRDRAPTPEELQRVVEIAPLREKVIISMLALGGFRVGTLSKLRYYHVMRDLEGGVTPVHVHVEAEITKGKYHDYDTFIGVEAVEYLRLYLDMRKRGAIGPMIPPEEIAPETPLIRSHKSVKPKPLDEKHISLTVHRLFQKSGILDGEWRRGRFYGLRPHSIRKFFRTQMAALGVPADYIEYMMGHTISTYHDVQMKGVEFLRNIYTASNLSIRPKTRTGRLEMLKEIIRAWGLNPEEILTRKALSMPFRTIVAPMESQDDQIKALSQALKKMLRRELIPARGDQW
jgi:site-specific recombinase XerD